MYESLIRWLREWEGVYEAPARDDLSQSLEYSVRINAFMHDNSVTYDNFEKNDFQSWNVEKLKF